MLKKECIQKLLDSGTRGPTVPTWCRIYRRECSGKKPLLIRNSSQVYPPKNLDVHQQVQITVGKKEQIIMLFAFMCYDLDILPKLIRLQILPGHQLMMFGPDTSAMLQAMT